MDLTSDMEFWLLVVGGAVIIGVIGFAIASSSARRHRRVRERNTTISNPSDLFDPLGSDGNGKPAKSGKGGRGRYRKEPGIGAGTEDAVAVDTRQRKGRGAQAAAISETGQGSLIDDAEENLAMRAEAVPSAKTESESGQIDHQPQLLVVYVMARGQGEFRCSGVNRVLSRSGCSLDERGVFHLKDNGQRSVFSVVNALEPATFDPDQINIANTRGLVFFLETQGQGDKRRFESMLGIARKLALELDGELLDDKREPLTSVREYTYKVDLPD